MKTPRLEQPNDSKGRYLSITSLLHGDSVVTCLSDRSMNKDDSISAQAYTSVFSAGVFYDTFMRRRSLSLIMAMNSLLVGLPRVFWIV